MPIRLLSFEQHDSILRIELLERNANPATQDDESKIQDLVAKEASYAILSHTWLRSAPGEITYNDWINGNLGSNTPGYHKLVNFCRAAWTNHKLSLGWIDTICINKDSSSELDESIRCMYNWYQRASVCIIHLAQTNLLSEIHLDPWFTRGWTLQELLAPPFVKFYNKDWRKFVQNLDNNKPSRYNFAFNSELLQITEQIATATTLTPDELKDIRTVSLSRRMQLAANRKVTREEDTAYSLMGIFDISMTTAYGEGSIRAFSRLLQKIINSTSTGILDLVWGR
ncbi:hypothetical protein BDN70DRAFT_951103 [Pholiota conissans]|uniref:Heterokaryon incompatibility domain-containing protein n=1 Tax=Pholiota conissans TaxID=109636 RepID=A0A9P5YVN4_9AGAR|nr:hypothetical protein BDN70DRAFT_951103 [Pholiota conissans]